MSPARRLVASLVSGSQQSHYPQSVPFASSRTFPTHHGVPRASRAEVNRTVACSCRPASRT
eukprot:3351109-Lingulodinium_polyedra.AAC.1